MTRVVWRKIFRRNERQPGGVYDVLICNHAVRVTRETNTYRRFRACVECARKVEEYRRLPTWTWAPRGPT